MLAGHERWQSTSKKRGGLTGQVELSQRGVAVPHPPCRLFVPLQLHGDSRQLDFYDSRSFVASRNVLQVPKFRRGQYFWHTRAMIGHAAARAVAQRVKVAEHTLHRHRALPHTRDDLAFPATLPSSHD